MFLLLLILSLTAFSAEDKETEKKTFNVIVERGGESDTAAIVIIKRPGYGVNAIFQGDKKKFTEGEINQMEKIALAKYFEMKQARKPLKIVEVKEEVLAPSASGVKR